MPEINLVISIPGLEAAVEHLASVFAALTPTVSVAPQAPAQPQVPAPTPMPNANPMAAPVGAPVPMAGAASTTGPVAPHFEAPAPPVAGAAPTAGPIPTAPAAPPQQGQYAAPGVPLGTPPHYTVDQIMAAGGTLMDAGKVNELMNLLHSFGVQAVMDLKPEQLGAFATALRELGAKI